MLENAILAIDQGTTSSRAIVFAEDSNIVSSSQKEFTQHYPQEGWVEHDPEEIWQSTLEVCESALEAAKAKGYSVKSIGITNQRETTVVWDKATGKPVYNAIVWQDRRTAVQCEALKAEGFDISRVSALPASSGCFTITVSKIRSKSSWSRKE